MYYAVQLVLGTASRDHGKDKGEVLLVSLIATSHSAGPGHGLCVADDTLQDDRNMLRQESLTTGGEHLGNVGAIFGQSWGHLWMTVGVLWYTLGSCWQCWGYLEVIVGGYLGPPWGHLGSCWVYVGLSWGFLGASSSTFSSIIKNS